jgi:hypothetical protein
MLEPWFGGDALSLTRLIIPAWAKRDPWYMTYTTCMGIYTRPAR